MLHDRVVTYRPRNPPKSESAGPVRMPSFGSHPSLLGETEGVSFGPILPLQPYPFFGYHPALGVATYHSPWFNRYVNPYFAPQNPTEYFQWDPQMRLYRKPAEGLTD